MTKRFASLLLAFACLLSLAACGAKEPEPTAETAATIATETTAATVPETTAPPVTVPEEGFLYLTVSRITFTMVGETENIYTGTVPVEDVTFGTGDESIATFENGILTATGVGETTAWAQFNDQRIDITVGCLVNTQEEFSKLDQSLLRSPKRYPPAVRNPEDKSFFADAAFVGDSITWTMSKLHTRDPRLGNVIFMTQGGSSITGFLDHRNTIYFQGKKHHVEDALAAAGVKKVFIMLGQNDLGYKEVDDVMSQWKILVTRIQDACPGIEIYLQSCIPEWRDFRQFDSQNTKIDQHNLALKAFAEEEGLHYVEVGAYGEDHSNKMPRDYHILDDTIHFNNEGNTMWMDLLLAYGEYQTMLGE